MENLTNLEAVRAAQKTGRLVPLRTILGPEEVECISLEDVHEDGRIYIGRHPQIEFLVISEPSCQFDGENKVTVGIKRHERHDITTFGELTIAVE